MFRRLKEKVTSSILGSRYKDAIINSNDIVDFITNKLSLHMGLYYSSSQHKMLLSKGVNFIELGFELSYLNQAISRGLFYDVIVKKLTNEGFKFKKLFNVLKGQKIISKHIKSNLIVDIENDNKLKRKLIKVSFMIFINSKPSKRKAISYLPKKVFYESFPNFSAFIDVIKSKFGHKSLHSLVTTIESELIFNTIEEMYNKHDTVCGSVHDAIYVPENKVSILTKILYEQSMYLLGNPVKVKVIEY